MGLGVAVARAGGRQRARALVAVALLLGLAGGVTVAAVAAASRGGSAPDRLMKAYRPPSLAVSIPPGANNADRVALVREVMATAGINDYQVGFGGILVTLEELPQTTPYLLSSLEIVPGPFLRPVLRHGRLPARADEIALNDTAASRAGVVVGDSVTMSWYPAGDLETLGGGTLTTPAGTRSMTVTGLVVQPADLTQDARAEPGTLFEGNSQFGYLAGAFWQDAGPDIAGYGIEGYFEASPAQETAVFKAADGKPAFVGKGQGGEDEGFLDARSAVRSESSALLVAAAILGLGSILFLGVALARVTNPSPGDRRILVGLGVTGRDLAVGAGLLGIVIGMVATAVAAAVAVGLSTRAPIGFAAKAEIDPGLDIDTRVLAAGGLAVLLVAVSAALVGTVRGRRESRTARRVTGRRAGPLTLAVGSGLLSNSARGRDGGGVRAAGALAILGAVSVVTAWTFAGTLAHVMNTPRLQGWNWDLAVGNFSQDTTADTARAVLAADPDIAAVSPYNEGSTTLDGHEVPVAGLDPTVPPVVLEGREPRTDDEVALGIATLARLKRHIGDEVAFGDPQAGKPTPFRIVGTVIPPAPLADGMSLDDGVVMTFAGYRRVAPSTNPWVFLVRLRAGVDVARARARLEPTFPGVINTKASTSDIRSLRRVQGLPYALATGLGILGIGAVVLVLGTLARRRRRELAMLRSVGFTSGQVTAVVLWQATLIAAGSLALGLPLGLAAGSTLWSAAADSIGTTQRSLMPVLPLLAAVAATVIVANGLALVPAWRASRRSVSADLRTE